MTISIENLVFSYGEKTVVDIPNWEVASGERVFLHGPSGSGKTTLLGLLAGILRPRSGRIEVLGQRMDEMSGAAKDRFRGTHLGYIFQMFNLLPFLSVGDNISLACEMNAARRARLQEPTAASVLRLAKALEIDGLLSKPVTQLSVGQQQRVAAARAFMGKPEIVIADEPTSALDTELREKFIELMFALANEQGTTVIFVSHDKTLAHLFDRDVALSQINKVSK